MVLIILNCDIESNDFESAIEVAMTMADMEIPCMFMIMPKILDIIRDNCLDRVKKIKQLELFNVPTFALGDSLLKDEYKFIEQIDKNEYLKYLEKCEKVVTF